MAKRVLIVDDHVPTPTVIRSVIEGLKAEQFEAPGTQAWPVLEVRRR